MDVYWNIWNLSGTKPMMRGPIDCKLRVGRNRETKKERSLLMTFTFPPPPPPPPPPTHTLHVVVVVVFALPACYLSKAFKACLSLFGGNRLDHHLSS